MELAKALPALCRAARQYDALLDRSGGDPAEAASRLWKRSRHDSALREDLVKAACLWFASGRARVDEAKCES